MRLKALFLWIFLTLVLGGAVAASLKSPYLAFRQPVYIAAGLAGVLGLCVMVLQPLLVTGVLPGRQGRRGRWLHLLAGIGLLILVVAHVGGLWLTSPPDVIDALMFRSPTPFAPFGVVAMWAVFLAGLLGVLRKRVRSGLRVWRRAHTGLVSVAVLGTVAHALLIEGTMEPISKAVVCLIAVVATAYAIRHRRSWF